MLLLFTINTLNNNILVINESHVLVLKNVKVCGGSFVPKLWKQKSQNLAKNPP